MPAQSVSKSLLPGGFIFETFLSADEVGSLAPIGVVMLHEALIMKRLLQHLNGKRVARF